MGVVLAIAASPAGADAQTSSPSTSAKRKIEVDAGVVFVGSATFAPANANLTAPDGTPLALFSTTNDLTGSRGIEAHVVFPLNRRMEAELSGTWTRADFQSRISGDFEAAEPVTATLGLSMYTVETSVVFYLKRRGKLDPFVRGGAGWLREVTKGGDLSADGVVASGGAGVKYWFRERDRGLFKRLGLRAEFRVVSRSGGLSLDLSRRLIAPAGSVSAILGF